VASEMCEGLAKMRGHHGIHDIAVRRCSVLVILVVIVVRAAVEVGGAFVFVWSTELLQIVALASPPGCVFHPTFTATYILVSCDELSHIARRILVELLVTAKDKDSDIDRAQNR
jgi:hypothetical protein